MDQKHLTHQGGCTCGKFRHEVRGVPKFISNCHCNSCRKATGAAFSTWVGFNADNVKWTTQAPNYYTSSKGVQRGFCRHCGTPLTYAGEKWPGETHFLIGTFDDSNAFIPNKNVFTEDALDWALK